LNSSFTPKTTGAQPTKTHQLTIPGEPRSKQRPRFSRGHAYTPKETVQAEKAVAAAWRDLGVEPFRHSVLVEIDFFNGNRRRRDLDNMLKLVLDALNTVAFDDDYQVVEINARKLLTAKENARTEIRLTELVLWPSE